MNDFDAKILCTGCFKNATQKWERSTKITFDKRKFQIKMRGRAVEIDWTAQEFHWEYIKSTQNNKTRFVDSILLIY